MKATYSKAVFELRVFEIMSVICIFVRVGRSRHNMYQMSRYVRQRTIGHVRPAKTEACAFLHSDQNLHWAQF